MTRRELLEKTTLALGYTLSAPTIMGILSGCEPVHKVSYKPVFFNDEQAIVISDLADIILPRTSTPGAKDVGVPSFIDTFIKEVFAPEAQEKFIKGLEEFNSAPIHKYFRKFIECTPDRQALYASEVHSEAIDRAAGVSEAWYNSKKVDRPFILTVKELTLLGFFSSEVGATQVLQYNPAPGAYQGCVPVTTVGKAWAT